MAGRRRWIVLFLFLGIFSGAFLVNYLYDIQWNNILSDMLSNYQKHILTDVQQRRYLYRLLVWRLFFLELFWACCCFRMGKVLIYMLLLFGGLWSGAMTAFCTIAYGAFGLWYMVLYCMPHFLFYIIGMSVAVEGFLLQKTVKGSEEIPGRIVISNILMILGVIAESYVHPLIMSRI